MLCALSAGAEYLVDAWPRRIVVDVGGSQHPVIGKDDFIRNKRVVARPRDLADIKDLTRKR
jgi:hypothetical protein